MTTVLPSITRILNDAQTRLPGALLSTIQNELFNVLHEFFQDSNSWSEDIKFNVVPTKQTYQISTDGVGQIIRIAGTVNSAGATIGASYPGMCDIRLYNLPSTADTYTATAILTVIDPVDTGESPLAPPWVFNKYGSGILDGILGRMMSQPAKPYSSTQLAIMHMRRFRSAVSMARIEAAHQNLYGGQRWAFPQSFSVRRR